METLDEACHNFYDYAPTLAALAIGAGLLLRSRSPSARSGGAVFAGLLAFLVPWLLVFSVINCAVMRLGVLPKVGDIDWNLARDVWEFAYISVETLAIILMARVLGNAARDVQPPDCAGPLESGDSLEVIMSKKNHSPGPVPPGNRAGGTDQGSPDTGAEHAPPQDGTGFAEEDPQRRLGGFTGKGEHSIQQPTPRQDGDAKAR